MTPSRQRALEVHADDVGREEVHRLAEHAGLGLDAAHAPADDADAVDHRGVAVGADQRVGVVDAVLLVHAAREVFEVDLVHDADAGRHDLERVERLHAPLHELVALAVALELELHVEVERVVRAVVVDLHRVVDDEVDRHQRLDDLRILAQVGGDVAHRGQVDQQRHAGEVLQHDARDDERDLVGARAPSALHSASSRTCSSRDLLAVAVAQHALEHDADRDRQARDLAEARGLERGQRVVLAGLAGRRA